MIEPTRVELDAKNAGRAARRHTGWYAFETHYGPPTDGFPFRNVTVGHMRAGTLQKAIAKARRLAIRREYARRDMRYCVYPIDRFAWQQGRKDPTAKAFSRARG